MKNCEKNGAARIQITSRFFSKKMSGGREWGALLPAWGAHALILFLTCSILGRGDETMARASRVVPRKGTFFKGDRPAPASL